MKIAIMQPTYLPWLGYFELIDNCDLFIFLDDVQFVKKSWQQRNRIKTPTGELLLTVPVLTKGKLEQQIKDVSINNDLPWKNKHLGSIINNYPKAAFYGKYIGLIKEIYSREYSDLLTLNIAFIEFIREHSGIRTKTMRSSQLGATGDRTTKIVNICKACKADCLYDAKGAADILNLNLFKQNNIEVVFQDYKHPTYNQIHGDFIPYLSALDLLLNLGEKSLEVIRSGTECLTV